MSLKHCEEEEEYICSELAGCLRHMECLNHQATTCDQYYHQTCNAHISLNLCSFTVPRAVLFMLDVYQQKNATRTGLF